MSRTFTKLFSSITESTVWCEPLATRIVWITMLAMADRKGRVWASVPGLANRARVTVEEAEAALARFLAPDHYSRTTDHEGRRIEPIDGGWRLLNYEKYRAIQDEEARHEYKQAWDRTRRHHPTNPTNPTESDNLRLRPTQAEAEAEAEEEKNIPTADAVGLPGGTPSAPPRVVVPDCPHEKIIALYAKHLPMGVQVKPDLWNGVRQKHLQARWRESRERQRLDWWDKFFAHCAQSPFLTGQVTSRDRTPFMVNLGWLVKQENFVKVCEGNYDHREAA